MSSVREKRLECGILAGVRRLAVMMYVRVPRLFWTVEDLYHERGVDAIHETVRFGWSWCGPMFAGEA